MTATTPPPDPPAAEAPTTETSPTRLSRGRRYTVRALLVLALLLAILSIFAVWANRQLLDANHWADTSEQLLQNDDIRAQLSGFLVDQVYTNVDVATELASALPPRLKPLAGPAANALRGLAERRTTRLLARPRVQEAWRAANFLTARQFINIAEGNSKAITTSGNAVILDVRAIVVQLAQQLGLPRAVIDKIPPNAGRIKIMSSDQIGLLQDATAGLRGLAFVLPLIAFALLALAVYLARGRRRRILLFAGIDLILAGLVVLVARTVIGNAVVNSLATTDSLEPAAQAAWSIGTGVLKDVAQAAIVMGIPVVVAAWLAGRTRPAIELRRAMAPWLREQPFAVYSVAAVLVLLVIAWGPIPATRMPIFILIMIALVIVGIQALTRQAAEEFPGASTDDTRASLHAAAGRAQRAVLGPHRTRGGATLAADGGGAQPDRLVALERLSALHASGALTDDEFSAEKASLLAAGTNR
jgi:putative oligomerization/nucleic acid binding protein